MFYSLFSTAKKEESEDEEEEEEEEEDDGKKSKTAETNGNGVKNESTPTKDAVTA